MRFLIGRHDYDNSIYKTFNWAVPIDCCFCNSGKVFPEPPHDQALWRCADCRGQFSIIKVH